MSGCTAPSKCKRAPCPFHQHFALIHFSRVFWTTLILFHPVLRYTPPRITLALLWSAGGLCSRSDDTFPVHTKCLLNFASICDSLVIINTLAFSVCWTDCIAKCGEQTVKPTTHSYLDCLSALAYIFMHITVHDPLWHDGLPPEEPEKVTSSTLGSATLYSRGIVEVEFKAPLVQASICPYLVATDMCFRICRYISSYVPHLPASFGIYTYILWHLNCLTSNSIHGIVNLRLTQLTTGFFSFLIFEVQPSWLHKILQWS